jgi:hypothetical protein
MADLKISALPASTTPLAGTEILPIVQSATTRQVSVANLTAGRAVSALSLTSTNDSTLSGLTVGRGGGSVSLNTAVGASALAATSTGDGNAALGASALASNLAGTGNTATGFASLRDNTSGNYNVASGYLALATNLSGSGNIGVGYSVLSTGTNTSNNTAIGYEALKVTSGSTNTAIGYQSGIAMTSGVKNVILGSYSGNNGTLDIRGNNNNIVLSDGDGNPRAWWDNANAQFFGTLSVTGLTNSGLTSGRVTYATTGGLLTDSAGLTYDGTNLTTTGTATATRFIPSGSTVATNGMYLPAANTLGFSTNSTQRITILATGEVGINNASPATKLDVDGTGYFRNLLYVSGSYGISSDAPAPLLFKINNVEKMQISSAGNVGIGTSSPNSVLQVNSGTNLGGVLIGFNSTSANFYDANTHYWRTGDATERMQLTQAGNLGIGTSSPVQRLQVSSAVGNPATSGSTQNGIVRLSNPTDNGVLDIGLRASGLGAWLQSTDGGASGLANQYALLLNPVGGNVGIGTSSPDTKLHVYATSNALTKTEAGTSGASAVYQLKTPDGEQAIYSNSNALIFSRTASFTESMRIDSSGNLGLGVTPSAWTSSWKAFQLAGGSTATDNSGTALFSFQNAYFNGTNFIYSSTAAATYYRQTSGAHSWWNAPSGTAGGTVTFTQAMTLDASGNLLVGTTSALSQPARTTIVTAGGNALVTQCANGTAAFQSTNASGTDLYYAAIFGNNGNTFSTCGVITVSGTTTSYVTSSDYRLKENVVPMTGALAKVAQLKPVTYKWKSDGADGQGFIAHELAEICPQAVVGEKDGLKADGSIMPQGIDTSFLVATLTKAIQEQQALIESLTTRLTALENK